MRALSNLTSALSGRLAGIGMSPTGLRLLRTCDVCCWHWLFPTILMHANHLCEGPARGWLTARSTRARWDGVDPISRLGSAIGALLRKVLIESIA